MYQWPVLTINKVFTIIRHQGNASESPTYCTGGLTRKRLTITVTGKDVEQLEFACIAEGDTKCGKL